MTTSAYRASIAKKLMSFESRARLASVPSVAKAHMIQMSSGTVGKVRTPASATRDEEEEKKVVIRGADRRMSIV